MNFYTDCLISADNFGPILMTNNLFSFETLPVSKKTVLLVATVFLANSFISAANADRSDFVLPDHLWNSSGSSPAPIYESLDSDLSAPTTQSDYQVPQPQNLATAPTVENSRPYSGIPSKMWHASGDLTTYVPPKPQYDGSLAQPDPNLTKSWPDLPVVKAAPLPPDPSFVTQEPLRTFHVQPAPQPVRIPQGQAEPEPQKIASWGSFSFGSSSNKRRKSQPRLESNWGKKPSNSGGQSASTSYQYQTGNSFSDAELPAVESVQPVPKNSYTIQSYYTPNWIIDQKVKEHVWNTQSGNWVSEAPSPAEVVTALAYGYQPPGSDGYNLIGSPNEIALINDSIRDNSPALLASNQPVASGDKAKLVHARLYSVPMDPPAHFLHVIGRLESTCRAPGPVGQWENKGKSMVQIPLIGALPPSDYACQPTRVLFERYIRVANVPADAKDGSHHVVINERQIPVR